jgi:excinuclease ABC subunit C
MQELRERLSETPMHPGVYLFKDAMAQILYVGKASVLRNRLRSYLGKQETLSPKIRRMTQRAKDFEFFVTNSESEALMLENTLIKRHRPPFNTQLRDDKTYPYIKIDSREHFPLVSFTRQVQDDGAQYFGPFASASSVRRTLDLLKKLFPYRSCTKVITGSDARPCLEYFINRCVAPCVGYSSPGEYDRIIQQVLMFLDGKTNSVTRQLKTQMQDASNALEFERAGRLRDQIRAIQMVTEEQKVVSNRAEDMDVIGLAQAKNEAWVEVFFIRKGKLIGRDHFTLEGTQDESDAQILGVFVKQFYDRASFVPAQILVPQQPEEANLIERWLDIKSGHRVALRVPARGEKRKLLLMVAENASQALHQNRVSRLVGMDAINVAIRELQEALNLPRAPRRIECYDISNTQGSDAVGSMVVFEEGKAKPSHYRRFKIRTVGEIDDYAMMREVLRRRFGRLNLANLNLPAGSISPVLKTKQMELTNETWGIVPDLVIIDGGKGHLSTAHEVFLELGISTDTVPLVALAKEREELFVPQIAEPIVFPRNAQGLFLVQRVRDEAHRFAIAYHKRLRSHRQVRSGLDAVPGIGPKRRSLLLRHFGSVKGIRSADVDDLAVLPGMNRRLALQVKQQL